MDLRQITIGRSRNCDIFLDPRCEYASNMHATIYYNGQHLVYRDTSTNGTIINGRLYKHQEVVIHQGDQIMLAGKYPLPWMKIDSFFPVITGTMASQPQPQPQYAQQAQQPNYQYNEVPMTPSANEYVNTNGWSWGAFQLYPIWGFANGCWWAIFIWLGVTVLSYFLTPQLIWLTRSLYVGIFLCWLIGFIPSLMFGLFGRRWAWNNRNWASGESFERTQHVWNIIGLILFIVSTSFLVISMLALPSIYGSMYLW